MARRHRSDPDLSSRSGRGPEGEGVRSRHFSDSLAAGPLGGSGTIEPRAGRPSNRMPPRRQTSRCYSYRPKTAAPRRGSRTTAGPGARRNPGATPSKKYGHAPKAKHGKEYLAYLNEYLHRTSLRMSGPLQPSASSSYLSMMDPGGGRRSGRQSGDFGLLDEILSEDGDILSSDEGSAGEAADCTDGNSMWQCADLLQPLDDEIDEEMGAMDEALYAPRLSSDRFVNGSLDEIDEGGDGGTRRWSKDHASPAPKGETGAAGKSAPKSKRIRRITSVTEATGESAGDLSASVSNGSSGRPRKGRGRSKKASGSGHVDNGYESDEWGLSIVSPRGFRATPVLICVAACCYCLSLLAVGAAGFGLRMYLVSYEENGPAAPSSRSDGAGDGAFHRNEEPRASSRDVAPSRENKDGGRAEIEASNRVGRIASAPSASPSHVPRPPQALSSSAAATSPSSSPRSNPPESPPILTSSSNEDVHSDLTTDRPGASGFERKRRRHRVDA